MRVNRINGNKYAICIQILIATNFSLIFAGIWTAHESVIVLTVFRVPPKLVTLLDLR